MPSRHKIHNLIKYKPKVISFRYSPQTLPVWVVVYNFFNVIHPIRCLSLHCFLVRVVL